MFHLIVLVLSSVSGNVVVCYPCGTIRPLRGRAPYINPQAVFDVHWIPQVPPSISNTSKMQQSLRLLSSIPRSLASSSTAPQVLLARAALSKTSTPFSWQRTAATSAAKTVPTASTKSSYSRYTAVAAAPASPTKGRTTKKATLSESSAAPTSEAAPSTTASVLDPTFPLPQPAAAIPDYAALAPPLEPSAASTTPPHSIHLVEAPGFDDQAESTQAGNDWSKSFHGLSSKPFDKEVAQILMRPLNVKDIEIKPGTYATFHSLGLWC